MRTSEHQKSTSHPSATPKPFFKATPDQAFFSADRAGSTLFFQRMPAFDSEVTAPVQAKLTVGQPGNQYEQEADRVASQVVNQIHAPVTAQSTQGQSVQRQEEKQEEVQTKPEITTLQRQEDKQEEVQAKSTLQGGKSMSGNSEGATGGQASTELASEINRARGSGQPLDAGLQRSMGQAMGADFSGVRIHTDAQADQLNRSIQAKAFTTGQDVFFQQGAYEPGSRGGQELIAHELTHVVQQNGGAVQRSSILQQEKSDSKQTNAAINTRELQAVTGTYLRKGVGDLTNTVIQKLGARDYSQMISDEISSSAPGRAAHKYILDRIFEKLDGENIPYKVGGSIAAKLLGARRKPNDLELEMPDMEMVKKGHGAVNKVATAYKIPNPYITIGTPEIFGVSIRFNGAIQNDTTKTTEPVRFEIDMMNENADEMNQQLKKPQVMDIFSGDRSREIDNVVERSRLIVNYADRSVNKSDTAREKQDYHQIHDLLQNGSVGRDAILEEVSHHGHARTNFDIKNVVRGQNKVSEFVESAEKNRWMENGKVKPEAGSAHLTIAKKKGWLTGDNKVNTKYELPAWEP